MFTIVSGSHKQQSNSMKTARFFEQVLTRFQTPCHIIDLAALQLPFWDEEVWQKGLDWHPQWQQTSQTLEASQAFIFMVPEYNGMVPARLKNLFLLATKEFAYKPALLVGISAGPNGAYPIIEMRSSVYKNSKINFMPDHLILRYCDGLFKENPNEEEKKLQDRISKTIAMLIEFAKVFGSLRETEAVKKFAFDYGM